MLIELFNRTRARNVKKKNKQSHQRSNGARNKKIDLTVHEIKKINKT